MKIQQETVYRCEHCNKPMFGKGAMVRHEKYCRDNPHNKHKCFEFCRHLKMTQNFEHDEYGNWSGGTTMLCEKKGIEMYSYKFEKNYNKPVTALNGLIRMPLECEEYEAMGSVGKITEDTK